MSLLPHRDTTKRITMPATSFYNRLQLIPLDLPLAHRAVQVAKDYRLRGADAVYVSAAATFDSKLIAWDAEMLARGTDVVTTMTSLEWMEEQAATG